MTLPSSSSKKILILHATAGAGHRKAAEAVHNGLKSRGIQADIVDALTYTSPFFSKTYSQGYEFMVGKLPKLWAIFFELTDQKWFQPIFRTIRRLYNRLNTAPLVRFIKDGQYDVIVTTHFLSTEVCGWLRRTGQINAKFVTIVTDFDVHRIWQVEGVDVYLVASEYTRRRILALGVDEKKVFVTGIPVDEKFINPRDRGETRRKLGLREDLFTVLLSTSSFGFGPLEELATLLKDLQLIIICGNNRALFEKMTAMGNPFHKICGFVDNMDEMMAASDVMITKPGGLSICEALANHLPLIFISAIPGQEAGNVRVLAEHGIGMSDKSLPEIAAALKLYASFPESFKAAREATKALAKPNSVADIIKHLVT
jgi:processive 1,2-diacylglycerol beta-glucosyltransferase